MEIRSLYDTTTATFTYLVWDPATLDAAVIDPVLDYDPVGSRTSMDAVDALTGLIDELQLKLRWVLETHAHADHLSSSQLLRDRYGAKIAIGRGITKVQATFKPVFDLGEDFPTDGSQFDRLLDDGDTLEIGGLELGVITTPGHTPACLSFRVEDALFSGDALLMDDYGTGRCDFPQGSAEDLYESVHTKLYALPDATRVFVGHDYGVEGREAACETTIGKSKANNPQLAAGTSRADFIRFRTQRDAQLQSPRLIFQSVQVNIDGGKLPKAQSNEIRYLKLPLNLFSPTDDLGRPR